MISLGRSLSILVLPSLHLALLLPSLRIGDCRIQEHSIDLPTQRPRTERLEIRSFASGSTTSSSTQRVSDSRDRCTELHRKIVRVELGHFSIDRTKPLFASGLRFFATSSCVIKREPKFITLFTQHTPVLETRGRQGVVVGVTEG